MISASMVVPARPKIMKVRVGRLIGEYDCFMVTSRVRRGIRIIRFFHVAIVTTTVIREKTKKIKKSLVDLFIC